MKKNIPVFKRVIARKLFQEGYKLVDFKANKENTLLTVFFFAPQDGLLERLKELGQWTEDLDRT